MTVRAVHDEGQDASPSKKYAKWETSSPGQSTATCPSAHSLFTRRERNKCSPTRSLGGASFGREAGDDHDSVCTQRNQRSAFGHLAPTSLGTSTPAFFAWSMALVCTSTPSSTTIPGAFWAGASRSA